MKGDGRPGLGLTDEVNATPHASLSRDSIRNLLATGSLFIYQIPMITEIVVCMTELILNWEISELLTAG